MQNVRECEKVRVRIPQLTSFENAIRIYNSKMSIGNKEIDELFAPAHGKKISSSTKTKLKELVSIYVIENNLNRCGAGGGAVATKTAFLAWGIDIAELEKGYSKLKKLGIAESN